MKMMSQLMKNLSQFNKMMNQLIFLLNPSKKWTLSGGRSQGVGVAGVFLDFGPAEKRVLMVLM